MLPKRDTVGARSLPNFVVMLKVVALKLDCRNSFFTRICHHVKVQHERVTCQRRGDTLTSGRQRSEKIFVVKKVVRHLSSGHVSGCSLFSHQFHGGFISVFLSHVQPDFFLMSTFVLFFNLTIVGGSNLFLSDLKVLCWPRSPFYCLVLSNCQ